MTYNIKLFKVNTRDDAEVPQEGKYPSNTVLKIGKMLNISKPKVGVGFVILSPQNYPIFHTSKVVEILEETDKNIKFKTLNSVYDILIDEKY